MEQFAAHGGTTEDPKPALYVVATPIGNLRDVTLRALDVLKTVALIAAEDTRVTARLLAHYRIATPLAPLHAHNERSAVPRMLRILAEGKSIALVSDAGTPAISDPGAQLVAAARAAGCHVVPVPGASALTAAISVAGYSDPHFLFYGFLPQRRAERRHALQALRAAPYPLVFYEAPHRIETALADLAEVLGDGRRVVIARELTKLFETLYECRLGDAALWIASDEHRSKGEFVLVVEGSAQEGVDTAQVQRVLGLLLEELPLKQAVPLAARITGAKRNDLYALALHMKKREG